MLRDSCLYEGLLIRLTKIYHRVRDTLRLAKYNGQHQGTVFPIPVILDVSSADIASLGLHRGTRVALRDPRDEAALAVLTSSLRPHIQQAKLMQNIPFSFGLLLSRQVA